MGSTRDNGVARHGARVDEAAAAGQAARSDDAVAAGQEARVDEAAVAGQEAQSNDAAGASDGTRGETASTTRQSTRDDRPTATADLDRDLGFQLVRASTISTRAIRAALEPLGLRARTFSALALAVSPGALGQRDLAAHLLLDPSQIVPIVDELERQGLVERTVDPADRRGRLICATAAGHEVHAEARRVITAADPGEAAGLSPDEQAQLLALLRRIAAAG